MLYTIGSIAVINIDAHLDVRPLKSGQAHSGSPFRCAFMFMTNSLGGGVTLARYITTYGGERGSNFNNMIYPYTCMIL